MPVITLGSPTHGDPRSTNLAGVPAGKRPERRRSATAPSAACRSTRADDIDLQPHGRFVAWQCGVEPTSDHTESIEVISSHCGLGVNASVVYAIADRLAQPEGEWKQFDRTGLRSWVFPNRFAKTQTGGRPHH